MRMRSIVAYAAAALAASISARYGGPCWDDLSAVQAKIDAMLEAKAADGPPATAEAMAETSPQPTPRSLETVEERMGEISPQTVNALRQGMAVRVQPMTLATRPHASRLWPTCGVLLVSSLRTTLIASADAARRRGDRMM
jgi:hypothetical protein